MDPHRLVLLCLFFVGFLEVFATSAKIAKMGKTNQERSMSGWSMTTQSHLMDITHVCMFFADVLMVWAPSQKYYLKPWEEIQHNQDLTIESANQFQHCL